VLGLDPSRAAVAAARKARRPGLDLDYLAGDAASLADAATQAGRFDVAFACNVYHLLSPGGRREFAAALATLVRPGGLIFLSTLSPRDPQHYAVGEPVSGEERSWVENVYLHFCTADELTADFSTFTLLDLEERSYDEHNAKGVVHRHASWFLEGRRD
jgi:2-polyprenyl-3-methyl-5-hydroxy-6-metoxy-1,4-benzoquinol methylase